MLKKTPLYNAYAKYGAKTIDFGGWDLPVYFSSIQAEHDAVRNRVGLFDVSHMGEVSVTGSDALPFIQRLTTNDAAALVIGQAQYSLMCYDNGGVVDDLLVYKLGENDYMLVINASNIEKDLAWMQEQSKGQEVTLRDVSAETALLALQGPFAEKVLQQLTSAPLQNLKSYHFMQNVEVGGVKTIVSRTGYTGEDGFELYVKNEAAEKIWELLLSAGEAKGIIPVGLGARDTLRFEARMPLYGQELSATISPIEAGLGFFVKLEKADFIGRSVLAEQKINGPTRKLVGIEMIDRGIPRSHYSVFSGEQQIGEVTTGTQSPTFKTNVGLALLDVAYTALGTEISVEIREKQLAAKVVKTPFYKRIKG